MAPSQRTPAPNAGRQAGRQAGGRAGKEGRAEGARAGREGGEGGGRAGGGSRALDEADLALGVLVEEWVEDLPQCREPRVAAKGRKKCATLVHMLSTRTFCTNFLKPYLSIQ